MKRIVGWKPKTLTELANYINGFAFKPDDWGKEGLPIIRIEQLKNPKAPADYFAGKLPSTKIIEDGDLIFSWSASLFLRIWQYGRAALNQHLFKGRFQGRSATGLKLRCQYFTKSKLGRKTSAGHFQSRDLRGLVLSAHAMASRSSWE